MNFIKTIRSDVDVPRRCFTILELLVVLAVIAILASLLLPALGKAKESARQISCMNNQKQLAVAFMSYSADFDSFLPWAFTNDGGNASRTYAHLLYNAGYSPLVIPPYASTASFNSIKKAERDVSPFKCPSDSSTIYNLPVNYTMNASIQYIYGVLVSGGEWWGIIYPKITKIKESLSEKSLIACSNKILTYSSSLPITMYYYSTAHDENGDGVINMLDRWRNLHLGYMNVLFCDGHIEKRKELKISKEIGN